MCAESAVILHNKQLHLNLDYEKGLEIRFGIDNTTCGSQDLTMGYTVVPPGARNQAHFHANAEAGMFVISGRLRVYVGKDRTRTDVESGSFIFVPKGEIHGIENPSPTEAAEIVFVYGNVPNKDAAGTVFVEEPWVQ